MKATLTFDLNDLDDRHDHLAAIHGRDMAKVLWHAQHNLYKELTGYVNGEDERYCQGVSDTIRQILTQLNDYGIYTDNLTY